MVKRDGAEIRKERIQNIAIAIQKSLNAHNPLPLNRTAATLAYDTGLTRDKIMEYLELLADLGQFTMDKEKDQIAHAENQP